MQAPAQRAIAMVSYEDVAAAAAWLERAFGFEEVEGERVVDGVGRVVHAAMTTPGGGAVFLGWPGAAYESPSHHREHCDEAARWLDSPFVVDGVLVYVDEVEPHADRARAGGAHIVRSLETTPVGRLYTAEDLEGHRWMFMEPV